MREKAYKQNVCALSADTFRRVYLLSLIGSFGHGVYGLKRLQKIAYISERENGIVKPFNFIRHHFGQYSDDLDQIKDQLISLGYVDASPLDTARKLKTGLGEDSVEMRLGGNKYSLTDRKNLGLWKKALSLAYPGLSASLDRAVSEYGYRKEDDLVGRCYEFAEFKTKSNGETIVKSDLPDLIEVPGLTEDECEELELAFSPALVKGMGKIVDGLEKATVDWKRVKKVALCV